MGLFNIFLLAVILILFDKAFFVFILFFLLYDRIPAVGRFASLVAIERLCYPLQESFQFLSAHLGQSFFSASQRQLDFYKMAFPEKFIYLPGFKRYIMLAGFESDPHGFHFLVFLLLAGFFFLALFLVDVLPVIHYPRHRRLGIRADFD